MTRGVELMGPSVSPVSEEDEDNESSSQGGSTSMLWSVPSVSESVGDLRSSKSSVATLNWKTPRIDPCGTPPNTGLGSDHSLSTLTVMFLLDRKVASSSNIGVLAPFLAKAFRQCWKLR